jgi:hypothetical protein
MVKDQSKSRDGWHLIYKPPTSPAHRGEYRQAAGVGEPLLALNWQETPRLPADCDLTSPGTCTPESAASPVPERQDDKVPPPQEATTVMHNQPPYRKESSDECRERADACLNWAREASTDEVRLACLTLANAWLKLQ